MKTRFAILVSSSLLFSMVAAYPQPLVALELTTEKNSYSTGDPIIVSGKVSRVVGEEQLIIRVFNPKNVAYTFAQLSLPEDGSFKHKFTIGGKLGIAGTYVIKANYAGVTAEKKIDITLGEKLSQIIKFAGKTFDVGYTIKNAKLLSIDVDPEFLSLLISVQSDEEKPGSLEVVLPRGLIDAKENARDKSFIVFVDGAESTYKELEATKDYRTLLVEFPEGSTDIEIVGTTVVPEFPAFSNLILAASIAAIIVFVMHRKVKTIKRIKN